jgi:hypothetical protein
MKDVYQNTYNAKGETFEGVRGLVIISSASESADLHYHSSFNKRSGEIVLKEKCYLLRFPVWRPLDNYPEGLMAFNKMLSTNRTVDGVVV